MARDLAKWKLTEALLLTEQSRESVVSDGRGALNGCQQALRELLTTDFDDGVRAQKIRTAIYALLQVSRQLTKDDQRVTDALKAVEACAEIWGIDVDLV